MCIRDREGADRIEQFGIYKPKRGERPLWDFPSQTLYQREWASWLLARELGWHIIPPTVVRRGPHGVGSLQLYLAPKEDALDRDEALEYWSQVSPVMEQIALFDPVSYTHLRAHETVLELVCRLLLE